MSNSKLSIAFDVLFPQQHSQDRVDVAVLFDEKYPAEAWMAIAHVALRAARKKLDFQSCACAACQLHKERVEKSLKVFECTVIDSSEDRRHAH